MSTSDRPCNKQPETESTAAPSVLTGRAEWLKQPRQHVARDRAAVMHFDDDPLLVAGHADSDWSSWCAVLNGIAGEIRQRLEDSMFVPLARAIDLALEREVAVANLRLELVAPSPITSLAQRGIPRANPCGERAAQSAVLCGVDQDRGRSI